MPPRDVAAALLLTLLSEAARGAVLPSLARGILAQGGSLSDVALAVSLFSLGRLIATMPLAYLAEGRRSTRDAVALACGVSVVGQVMYAATAGVEAKQTLVLASRFVIGLGTGTLGVCRGYIATRSSIADRTHLMALAGLCQFMGFALAPGIALMFPALSTPGILMAILNGLALVLVFFALPSTDLSPGFAAVGDATGTTTSGLSDELRRLEARGFVVFLALNVILRGILSDAEALVPTAHAAIYNDQDNDEIEDQAKFFLVLGFFGSMCFVAIDPFIRCTRMRELSLFIIGILLVSIGGIFLMDPVHNNDIGVFSLGAVLIWCLGSPITQTFTISLYSKLLGSKPQTVMLGWLTMAGSIGRIVFPGVAAQLDSTALWSLNGVLGLLTIFPLVWFYRNVASQQRSRTDASLLDTIVPAEEGHLEMSLLVAGENKVALV